MFHVVICITLNFIWLVSWKVGSKCSAQILNLISLCLETFVRLRHSFYVLGIVEKHSCCNCEKAGVTFCQMRSQTSQTELMRNIRFTGNTMCNNISSEEVLRFWGEQVVRIVQDISPEQCALFILRSWWDNNHLLKESYLEDFVFCLFHERTCDF